MVSVASNLAAGDAIKSGDIDRWLLSVARAHNEPQLPLLKDVCALAQEVYRDKRNDCGETLMRHALSIADILVKLDLDQETLAVAILNGVLDPGTMSGDELRSRFGDPIANMVVDLARIGQVAGVTPGGTREVEHAENLRRLLLGIADDVRVVLVVVAERLHRMRRLRQLPEDVQRRLANETLNIYAPLANRLGIWQIKWEMEDLCLRALRSDEYNEIASLLDERRQDREGYIAEIIAVLLSKFQDLEIEADIKGRPKHIYSIWRKMKRKDVGFHQIFDVRAVRVQVNTVADCYAALGVVHGLWRHIPGEFDDYIATPKANMYQSLHTAVIGPEEKPVEIQIRTKDMHYHSELGVAAHWRYKENTREDAELERRILWMRHWLELKDDAGGAEGFVDRFKSEFEPIQIYVLTPQAKVIELPKGSTPVDFAYAIHTDVGHRCRGARVNGRIVPLTQALRSGETVEILTAKTGKPSRDWVSPHLGYLHTARARNRVRQWFKQQDYDQHVQHGRVSLERELTRLGILRPDLEALAEHFNLKKAENLLAAIGCGEISPVQAAGAIGRQSQPRRRQITVPVVHKRPLETKGEVAVAGVDNLMTHMARCCKPVPYDGIVGFITRGRGVTVHREDCGNIAAMDEEERQRLVEVVWSDQPEEIAYPVDVLVRASDRQGLLRDLSSLFTNEEVDVIGVNTVSNRKTDIATMRFTVEISNIEQLSRVLNKVAQLPDVMEVRRQV